MDSLTEPRHGESPKDLEWVHLVTDLDNHYNMETPLEKIKRKVRENPLVPIGCLLTTTALGYGLYYFNKGNIQKQQLMMRYRITAQLFTIIAAVGGITLKGQRSLDEQNTIAV